MCNNLLISARDWNPFKKVKRVESPLYRCTVCLFCPLALVGADLAITQQPQDQKVIVGATANFQVAATGGTAPLTYEWALAGQPIAGSNTASYTFPATTAVMSHAQVTVKVTDANGKCLTSSPATLTVTNPPPPDPPVQPWVSVPDGTEAHAYALSLLWGQENSNLYRANASASFFSGSKGMIEMDFDYRWNLGGKRTLFLEHDINIGLRGAFGSNSPGNAQPIITSSQNFFTHLDVGCMWKPQPTFALGLKAGITWASYPLPPSTPSTTDSSSTGSSTTSTNPDDQIRSITSYGFATEAAFGATSNLSATGGLFYQIDPLYAQPHRVDAIGRVVYHATVNVFLEGELNKGLGSSDKNPGRVAQDVGFLRFGVVLDPTKLFTGIGTLFTPK
jgi:hypothetical protein